MTFVKLIDWSMDSNMKCLTARRCQVETSCNISYPNLSASNITHSHNRDLFKG